MRLSSYTWPDVLRGMTIYAVGDTIAALVLREFFWMRLAGIMVVGGALYALEIPNYFQWIDSRRAGKFQRTVLAMLYFNPLWIARHILFIKLFSGRFDQIGWHLVRVGAWSFLTNVPFSAAGNYLIQNVIPLRHRFLRSALFSAMMAIYYAVSSYWFR